MDSSKKREHCIRTILLTIISSAIISIVIFTFLQVTGREKNLTDEIPKENSFQSEKLMDEKCIPVCDSRNCITQANMLLRSIRPSTDPCENFHKFLCGSYEEKFGRNESRVQMQTMEELMWNNLKSLIENVDAEPGSASAKMKMMYDSCINIGSEVNGIENFRRILNSVEIFEWPLLDSNFKFSEAGLPTILGTLKSYFELRFIGMVLNSVIGKETEIRDRYIKVFFMQHIVNTTLFIPRNVAADILKYFEIQSEDIETILNDQEEVKNSLISFFEENQDDCGESCTNLNIDCSTPEDEGWEQLCEMVQVYFNNTELTQYATKNIIVIGGADVSYAKKFIPHFKSLTDKSVANFFALNFLWHHLDEVNFFFRRKKQKYFDYFKDDYEMKRAPFNNKWQYCVLWISEKMKYILENEFMKSYLTRAYVKEIQNNCENYTSLAAQVIKKQKWIPFLSKLILTQHVKKLQCNLEYAQQHLPNDTYYDEFLKTFKPTNSFLRNVVGYYNSILNSHTRLQMGFERMREPVFLTNAATDLDEFIELFYGILMPPVYYPGYEKFVNHILLAPIIVHEIGHNIVSFLEMIERKSNETEDIYLKRKDCFTKQFSKFKFKDLDEYLKGEKYFSENLSDSLAYTITDKKIKELRSSEEVFLLPGLPYSADQMLLMSSRQVFCSKLNQNSEEVFKTKEKHAPPEYRIIGSVMNSKEYSEIFSCPEGSFMNPTEKCTFLDTV